MKSPPSSGRLSGRPQVGLSMLPQETVLSSGGTSTMMLPDRSSVAVQAVDARQFQETTHYGYRFLPLLHRSRRSGHLSCNAEGRSHVDQRLLPGRPKPDVSPDRRLAAADELVHRANGRTERGRLHGRAVRHGVGSGGGGGPGGHGLVLPASLPEERDRDRAAVSRDPVRSPDAGHHQPDLPGGLRGDPASDHPIYGRDWDDRHPRRQGNAAHQPCAGPVADRVGGGHNRLVLRPVRR